MADIAEAKWLVVVMYGPDAMHPCATAHEAIRATGPITVLVTAIQDRPLMRGPIDLRITVTPLGTITEAIAPPDPVPDRTPDHRPECAVLAARIEVAVDAPVVEEPVAEEAGAVDPRQRRSYIS